MNYRDPELRRRLADAYVMGTMSQRARQRFQRLMGADATLAAVVQASEARWNGLVHLLPPSELPPRLWAGVARRIAPPPEIPQAPSRSSFWRGWALVASLLVVVLGGYLGLRQPPLTAVNYIVVITDDAQSRASWVIGADQRTQEIVVRALAPQPIPADRDFQLWVQLPGEPQVKPVGLIPEDGQTALAIPADIANRLVTAEKLGVSIEPQGGSPTGQPTTTPLYHGQVTPL